MLGWDITDDGMGAFDKMGFPLITIRNGNLKLKEKYSKVYAEKLLYLKESQYFPMHFHWYKAENIINRGGGNVLIRVYNSTKDEDLDKVSINSLRQAGIGTEGIISTPDVFTTLAFVTLDPSGDRTFSFARKPGADTQLCFER